MHELEDLHADRTNTCFTTMEAEVEGRDPQKLAYAPSCLLLTIPRRLFYCGIFIECSVVFHLQMFSYNNYVSLR